MGIRGVSPNGLELRGKTLKLEVRTMNGEPGKGFTAAFPGPQFSVQRSDFSVWDVNSGPLDLTPMLTPMPIARRQGGGEPDELTTWLNGSSPSVCSPR